MFRHPRRTQMARCGASTFGVVSAVLIFLAAASTVDALLHKNVVASPRTVVQANDLKTLAVGIITASHAAVHGHIGKRDISGRASCLDPAELVTMLSQSPKCMGVLGGIMAQSQGCISVSGGLLPTCDSEKLLVALVPSVLSSLAAFCDDGCGTIITNILAKCGGESLAGLVPGNETDITEMISSGLKLACGLVAPGSTCRPVIARMGASPQCVVDLVKISVDVGAVAQGTANDTRNGDDSSSIISGFISSALPYLTLMKTHTRALCSGSCGSIFVDFIKYCEPALEMLAGSVADVPALPVDVIDSLDGQVFDFMCTNDGHNAYCGEIIADAINRTLNDVMQAPNGLSGVDQYCILGATCSPACDAMLHGMSTYAGCCYAQLLDTMATLVPGLIKAQGASLPAGTDVLISVALKQVASGENKCGVKMPPACTANTNNGGGMHSPTRTGGDGSSASSDGKSSASVAGIVVGVIVAVVGVYFVLGFVYKRYAMGLKGADQIPHINTLRKLKLAKGTTADGRGGFMKLDEVEV